MNAELSHNRVGIIGAPLDLGQQRRGVDMGPSAIRYSGLSERLEGMGMTVHDHGDARAEIPELASERDERARYLPAILGSCAQIAKDVSTTVQAGAMPLVLGGDHSIAFPDISTVAAAHEPGSLAVVQFDTHADTATECYGIEWSHGTPFRNLVDRAIIPGHRLIQIGLRGFWPGRKEFDWMRSAGVRWHRMDEIVDLGIDAVLNAVLYEIGDASHLFLSIDIDALDPAYAPGTGTPEPGGMTTRELLRAVRRLTLERGLAGMEVVEVSPPYDHAQITAMAAHRVVLEALSGLAAHRAGTKIAPEDPAR